MFRDSSNMWATRAESGLEHFDVKSQYCLHPAPFADGFKNFTKVLVFVTLMLEAADLATSDADAAYNMSMIWITATALIIMFLLEKLYVFRNYYFFTITFSCVAHSVKKPHAVGGRIAIWLALSVLGCVLMYAKGFMHAHIKLRRNKVRMPASTSIGGAMSILLFLISPTLTLSFALLSGAREWL